MKVPKAKKTSTGYRIQLRLDGESIPITESTEKKCTIKAQLIKAEFLAGKRDVKSNAGALTLKQAIDDYINSRDNILSPMTIRGYESIRNNRFKNYMDKPINDIISWQTVINDESKIVGARTVKNAWDLVSSTLRYHSLPVPEKITLPQIINKDAKWIEPENIPLFIKAIEEDSCEIQILLALHGLRRSELIAVNTWDKVDLINDLIYVKGSIVPDRNSKYVYKETNKNSPSRRTIKIMIPRLKELLVEYKNNDKPIIDVNPNTILRRVYKACDKAGIKRVDVHGLRKSFASLCYYLEMSEKETMKLGGWSDAGTMRKIYIQISEKDKEKAESKLTDFFTAIY